jgi:predicted negative regulator of RcsB-dependent stress response
MITQHVMAASGADATAIWVTALIVFFVATAVIWLGYLWLLGRRADAAAMTSYRKLAEEVAASQAEVRDQMTKLNEHMSAIEQLMRDVGL